MLMTGVANGVATVTMNRPPVNAISEDWLRTFEDKLDVLTARSDWTVLHIRSDLRTFCAGADLQEVARCMAHGDGPDRMFAFVAAIQRLYARIERLPRVTLAEVGGAAMGGGLELALACDLRIASSAARLGLPEVQLGLIPGAGGTQRLTRLCGRGVAARLTLGAEIIDGETACELGVVQWAVPATNLQERAREIARRIALLPIDSLAAAKAAVAMAGEPGRGGYADELEATRRLLVEAETIRRVQAFLAHKGGESPRLSKGAVS